MSWKYGRQSPDNNLMRFVGRRFPESAMFLDIGSGEGANSRELRERGHEVITIDKDPSTDAMIHADVRTLESHTDRFDCIYDVNTLCHVENPPFEKIRDWLQSNCGTFFSIWPAYGTWPGVKNDKEYTRLIKNSELHRELRPLFSEVKVYGARAPAFLSDGTEAYLDSWIVEARP